jgi:hypothetical protein
MSVSKETETKVGECQICGINVYDRGNINKAFIYLGKERLGMPREIAMPCGLKGCPFETKEEQDKLRKLIEKQIFSGENNWDGIT